MYESFYGLREKPFNLTPDPRFLYLSEMHKEAFAHLIFGIRNRVGFIMVTGEIGTGKTTICRSLLGQLDQDVELAFIFNPCLSPEELLRKINEDFGIRSRAISVKGLIDDDKQDPPAGHGQIGTEVDGCSSLGCAALLIDDCDNPAHRGVPP